MSDPYRSGSVPPPAPPPPRHRQPESEPSPLRFLGRARAYSDGSTELRFRPGSVFTLILLWGLGLFAMGLSVLLLSTSTGSMLDHPFGAVYFVAVALATLCFGLVAFYTFGGERLVLGPSGFLRQRGRRRDVALLDDISTVVVSGSGRDARVDVQLGRQRLQILSGMAYSEEQLRWCAQRLRRALDHARAARNG